MRALATLLLLAACGDEGGGKGGGGTGEPTPAPDMDGDGVSLADGDCGDRNSDVYPGATELCDGVDNDCDGETDEDLDRTWYRDRDGDGYGDPDDSIVDCDDRGAFVDNGHDCDDADNQVSPDAEELCDGVDNDCDGELDEDVEDEAPTWHADADGDGYADPDVTTVSCVQPDGWLDAPVEGEAVDCDDTRADVHPFADETCDGDDNDCDGEVDEEAMDAPAWFRDADGDGYGIASETAEGCDPPSGYAETDTDCDDGDPGVSPGATETCDGEDDDCDGTIDEDDAADAPTWYTDGDGDGYGDAASSVVRCEGPAGTSATAGDCDDTDALVSPDGVEVCNSADDDCDGTADDDPTDASVWYPDGDGDGYGDDTLAAAACTRPSGHVSTGGDCDDGDAAVNPGESEVCGDGVDNDCDGGGGGCSPTGDSHLASADGVYTGEAASCNAGFYTSPGAGDHDGDGDDDLLVGAMGCSSSTGAAYVVNGPANAKKSLSTATADMTGESTGDSAGFRVAWAGDLDLDGRDDMLVSAWKADSGGSNTGTVYVVLGPGYKGSLSGADEEYTGAAAEDTLGTGLAAGDFDGDGWRDLALGATGADSPGTNAGAVYLVFGPVTTSMAMTGATVILTGADAEDGAGGWLDAGSDVNADGMDDLLVGGSTADASTGTAGGVAWLEHGPITTGGSLGVSAVRFYGRTAYDYAGFSVAGPGDVDGDGYGDVLVGAYGQDDGGSSAGQAYLILGPASTNRGLDRADAILTGEEAGDGAGFTVAGAGDTDGDGRRDILAGAWRYDDAADADAGVAYLLYGPVSGSIDLSAADARFFGDDAADYAGAGLGGIGDTDADGYDDFLVGAYGDDGGGSAAGAVYVVLGEGM